MLRRIAIVSIALALLPTRFCHAQAWPDSSIKFVGARGRGVAAST